MKKYAFIAALATVALVATTASAQEKYVVGTFEMTGHVVTGGGWQHQQRNAHPAGSANSEVASFFGPVGGYTSTAAGGFEDRFLFFVDELELDVMKAWGENIRIRADIDMGRATNAGSGSPRTFGLEQAYVTANIPVGNGVEFLLGRFNAPVGFESVDVTDNDLVSKTQLIRSGLRPVGLTGAKLYYAFSDMIDFHLYFTNSILADTVKVTTDTPSGGFRVGANWGDEGNESTVGLSLFGGAETPTFGKKFTFGGDVDWNWWITESFALGGEALFVRDPKTGLGTSPNAEFLAGLLNLHYAFSDVWDGTLRYALTKSYDVSNLAIARLGFEGTSHEFSVGGSYAVADGAKLKLEGRWDFVKNQVTTAKSYDYGAVFAFAYDF